MKIRNASIKAAIVLVPSYVVAYLTEQMVYVVPMLAATSFFAGTVDLSEKTNTQRVDEAETDQGDDPDAYELDNTTENSSTLDIE
jgi:hypothetical protein|tara:strand:+ start:111 stop:365 length:255 start_codon:yes stop_codon:yes gene_type:complete